MLRFRPHARRRTAFTLLELMVSVTIIGMTAVVVIPELGNDRRARLVAASSILISDIEMAQVMTISYPSEPVVVRFDPARNRYWLAYADTPEQPLTREDTGDPYLVRFGTGRAASAAGVVMTPVDMAANTLAFNEQGGLTDFASSPSITLTLGEGAVQLNIAPATGTVTEGAG